MRVLKIVGAVVVGLFVLGLLGLHGSRPQGAVAVPPPRAHPTTVAQPNAPPGALPELEGGKPGPPIVNLEEALTFARPYMADVQHGDESPGTAAFAAWAARYMTWADVYVKRNETIPARVRKDPDAERGKRLCAPPATIVEIHREKNESGSLFSGEISKDHETLHFYAVRSTGHLVEGSEAAFCGFVMGLFEYEDRLGRTQHATEIVGMFDLPENRASH